MKRPDAEWPLTDIEEDPRYAQCNREMIASILYWLSYGAAVIGTAALLGYGRSATEIGYVFGIPSWMFWGAVVGLFFCAVVPTLLIKTVFANFSVAADPEAPDTLLRSDEGQV